MIRTHTEAAIRAAEEPLLAAGVPLMRHASTALALAVSRRCGTYGVRVLILAGSGNNGGDALYAGAYLARRGTWVCALDGMNLHAAARKEAERAGVRFIDESELEKEAVRCEVWIDGLLGIGVRGAVREPVAGIIRRLKPLRDTGKIALGDEGRKQKGTSRRLPNLRRPLPYVVAVDLPSGVESDSGALAGPVLRADLTVTMGAPKPALYLEPARSYTGEIQIVPLGLNLADEAEEEHKAGEKLAGKVRLTGKANTAGKASAEGKANATGQASVERKACTAEQVSAPEVRILEEQDIRAMWPIPGPNSHKYTRGVVGIRAGSATYPGAAYLATEAALALGPGMVRYVGPSQVAAQVVARCPEIVCGQGHVQSWVIGPGLDTKELEEARKHYEELAHQNFLVPVVLDAGAVIFAAEECEAVATGANFEAALSDTNEAGESSEKQPLKAQLTRFSKKRPAKAYSLKKNLILTPHAGELEKLFAALGKSITRAEIESCPLRYASLASQLTGAVVVLKGAVDIVCLPLEESAHEYREAAYVSAGPAWRATAGAGDVLAGMIGAALAMGLKPVEAAAFACYLHAAASENGPMKASQIAARLPSLAKKILSEEKE